MGKQKRDEPVPRGVKADLLIEIAACHKCLMRLAALAQSWPEEQRFHEARTAIGTLLNRLNALQTAAIEWV